MNVEHADPDEQSAQGHRGWIIDSQDGNGRTADWRATNEHRLLPLEMFSPHISPWMEQPNDLTNYRVNAGQVCALVAVAVDAAQRKVLALGWAAVLLSDDVVDLKVEDRRNAPGNGSTHIEAQLVDERVQRVAVACDVTQRRPAI